MCSSLQCQPMFSVAIVLLRATADKRDDLSQCWRLLIESLARNIMYRLQKRGLVGDDRPDLHLNHEMYHPLLKRSPAQSQLP